jgi:DNA invertase Pin-like site-specific DNA recombinase
MRLSRKRRAVLLIARLDRPARSVAFISALTENGTDFIACDMPQASRLTIHILAAVAEHERQMISNRTKAALQKQNAEEQGEQKRGGFWSVNDLYRRYLNKSLTRYCVCLDQRALQDRCDLVFE